MKSRKVGHYTVQTRRYQTVQRNEPECINSRSRVTFISFRNRELWGTPTDTATVTVAVTNMVFVIPSYYYLYSLFGIHDGFRVCPPAVVCDRKEAPFIARS